MTKRSISIIILILLLSVMQLTGEDYYQGRLNIKVQSPFSIINKVNGIIETEQNWFNNLAVEYQISDLKKIFHVDYVPFLQWYTLEFPDSISVEMVLNSFQTKSEIIIAEPSYRYELCYIPDDSLYYNQWALPKIQAEDAWEIETGSEDVIVGVIDTGIDLGNPDSLFSDGPHPDLDNNIIKDEYGEVFGHNFINPDWPNVPFDENGHGTHVSGIIAAVTNNNIGVAGLAGGWGEIGGVKIMPVKVFPRSGGTPPNIVAAGILWAADPDGNPASDDGCDIINMSWGGPTSSVIELAIDSAYAWGITLIASAGNGYTTDYTYSYPAKYPEVIAVVSTDSTDTKSDFSTYGYWTDISAPGGYDIPLHRPENILSTTPHYPGFYFHELTDPKYHMEMNYDYADGTSMAAPYIAGLTALIKSHFPGITNDSIRERILGTTDELNLIKQEHIGKVGAGRINTYHALIDDPHPNIMAHSLTIIDGNNGIFECGEIAELEIELKNWWIDAYSVTGTLYTDDPAITISNNELDWGDISQDSVASHTPLPEVIDSSLEPRVITLQLEIEVDNMETKILHIPLELHPNVNTSLLDTIALAGEEITTRTVLEDIDNDGIDEIIIGASNGNVYIYNHPDNIITLETSAEINCTPAVGDIDNDGEMEIVAGNDNGEVWVWDYQGNVQFTISSDEIGGKVTNNIVIEDVTEDGQQEIIVTTKYWGGGIDGFHIIDIENQQVHSQPVGKIEVPISVADVNNDSKKEILLNIDSGYAIAFKVYSVNSDYSIIEEFSTSVGSAIRHSLSGPIVANIKDEYPSENDLPEIIISYYQFDNTAGRYYQVSDNIAVYHFGEENPVWSMDYPAMDKKSQIIVGDFSKYDDGLEIIFYSWYFYRLLDCDGNEIEHTNLIDSDNISQIFCDLDNSDYQEFISLSNDFLTVFDNKFNELPGWKVISTDSKFVNISVGNVISNNDNSIILTTEDGKIYAFPIDYSPTSISEWPQYQNNARNTGCYFQPLPEDIAQDITVKHNAVIDKTIGFPAKGVTLTVESGNEILFKPLGSICGGNIFAVGTEDDSITFAGLCADTTKEYWDGISIVKDSQCHFKHCNLQNAISAIFMEDIGNQYIENCIIENNATGIFLYNSSPIIKENIITWNDFGIAGLHNSMPILTDLSEQHIPFANALVGNTLNIFLDGSITYLNNGQNDIFSLGEEYYIRLRNYPDRFLEARRNYWGTTDIEEIYTHLDPADKFIIEPICEEPNTSYFPYISSEFDLLREAYTYLGNEDYVNAEISFKNLIATYPETQEADQSISGLFICYKESEGNWDEFETYINNLLNQPGISETSQKLWFSYLNLCKREKEEYDIAIANYESILENNPTYEDSCYAVIDIGNTYLEAGNGGKSISGKYPELIPLSAELHQKKSRELLNSILTGKKIRSQKPEISKLILHQNYPNPYKHNTTISYAIPKSGTVSLKIYNIKGQLVKTVVNEHKEKGYYTEIWDGRNDNGKKLANGIYFYKIKIEGKSKVKKMLLLR